MENMILDEKELEHLFAGYRRKKSGKFRKIFLGFLSFVVIYGIVFSIINFPGLKNNFVYWYKTEYKSESYVELSNQDKLVSTLNPTAIKTVPKKSLPEIPDNYLKIAPIDVLAPITWRVPNKPDPVRNGLENGLIQIENSALPGETGNVFITGHSSDFPWSKGNYKTVFVLLNKLSVGDVIQLKYQNSDFLYRVSQIKTVDPDDTSVLNRSDKSVLTLMTCTPVGTTLRRLIVVAEQIYPDPLKNIRDNRKSTDNKSLPVPR